MHLSDHSITQLDEAYVHSLDEGRLRGLSLRLLEDLKEARERLHQNGLDHYPVQSSSRQDAGTQCQDGKTLSQD